MPSSTFTSAFASFLLALTFAACAFAQAPPSPTIEMVSTSVNAGIGGQSGDGVLRLPNLGTDCAYPFKVSGFGAGVHVGVSKASAVGVVTNMTKLSDFPGNYVATQGEATLIAGAGSTSMKNQSNDVVIGVKSRTEGLALGFGAQGMTVQLADSAGNLPHGYFLTFGFGKSHINQEDRAILAQVLKDWKCRYGNIRLYGHTDTVGKEVGNLDLSAQRAIAVRDYLVRAGVAPARITTQEKGEDKPLATTANNARLRTNRNVVVVVEE